MGFNMTVCHIFRFIAKGLKMGALVSPVGQKKVAFMNRIMKFLGFTAFVAVIAFSMTACDDDTKGGFAANTDPAIYGMWRDVNDPSSTITINSNGTFTAVDGGTPIIRGTYTAGGGSFTGGITEINSIYLDYGLFLPNGWYNKVNLMQACVNYWKKQGLNDYQVSSASQQLQPEVDRMYSAIKGTYSGNTMSMTYAGGRMSFTKM